MAENTVLPLALAAGIHQALKDFGNMVVLSSKSYVYQVVQ